MTLDNVQSHNLEHQELVLLNTEACARRLDQRALGALPMDCPPPRLGRKLMRSRVCENSVVFTDFRQPCRGHDFCHSDEWTCIE